MSNYVMDSEIVHQNNILEILEQLGFKENKDFIFLPADRNRPIEIDSGAQKYVLKLEFQDIRGAVDEKGHIKPGVTSGNNGVGAVYVPFQGMVVSPNYDIKDVMEKYFFLKDTGFSVPLSNGELLLNKSLQSKWQEVKDYEKGKKLSDKNFSSEELKQKQVNKETKFLKAKAELEKKLNKDKLSVWAKEKLQELDM